MKRILYGFAVIEYSLLSAKLHGIQVSAKRSSETIAGKPALYQNYPNPFNSTTIISYELPASSYVSLEIYSITGQKVRELVAQYQQPGRHQVQWDGTSEDTRVMPSGLYIYRLAGSDWSMYGKLVLLH